LDATSAVVPLSSWVLLVLLLQATTREIAKTNSTIHERSKSRCAIFRSSRPGAYRLTLTQSTRFTADVNPASPFGLQP
jgi:hypothetical protein